MPDNLTVSQRSYCMSRVKGSETSLETTVRSALHKRGLRFRKNVRALPGSPDIVFPRTKVAVFLHGDFWHGYRFPTWKMNMSKFWQNKIELNRMRDRRNSRRLRQRGWKVMSIWQHEVRRNFEFCIAKIASVATKE